MSDPLINGIIIDVSRKIRTKSVSTIYYSIKVRGNDGKTYFCYPENDNNELIIKCLPEE